MTPVSEFQRDHNRRRRRWQRNWEISHPDETCTFILFSALDLFLTYLLLRSGSFRESNPIALYVLTRYGMRGMIGFKFALVAFICVISHVVGLYRPQTALWLLRFAIGVQAFVVAYSAWLAWDFGGFTAALPSSDEL